MTTGAPANGAKVRREMVARGLDGRALSQASGISEVTISHLLNGRPVRHSTLRRVAEALARIPELPGAELLA